MSIVQFQNAVAEETACESCGDVIEEGETMCRACAYREYAREPEMNSER